MLRIRDLSIRLPGVAAAARPRLKAELIQPIYTMSEPRRWRSLTAPGTGAPTRILAANERRRGIQMVNVGTGQANISGSPIMDPAYPIGAEDTLAPSAMPFSPHNDLYATGEPGHDLYVIEFFEP
jgi:hypothetical protein